MGQVHHGSATTTAAVRRAIQNSEESLRPLSKRYGINQKTVAKWKQRTSIVDLPTGPKEPHSTVLSRLCCKLSGNLQLPWNELRFWSAFHDIQRPPLGPLVILLCVRWYLAYGLSLRDLKEMMAERGISVDHSTIHRWTVHFSPVLLKRFNRRKRPVGSRWHVDCPASAPLSQNSV